MQKLALQIVNDDGEAIPEEEQAYSIAAYWRFSNNMHWRVCRVRMR